MTNKVDIATLGVMYSLFDKESKVICRVKVIDSRDLYALTQTLIDDPLDTKEARRVIKQLSGLYRSPYQVSWYATAKEEYAVENAVIQARLEGNAVVVLEMLEDHDDEFGEDYV